MPKLVVIRIHPVVPTTGDAFLSYLQGLRISASDISYADPDGQFIGEAVYDSNRLQSRIVQHFTVVSQNPLIEKLYPVATAIIEVIEPPGRPEYDTLDLLLQIERGGRAIADRTRHYNVALLPSSPLPSPPQYATIGPVGIYLALPGPGVGQDPGLPYIELPTDGTPPPFDVLRNAVEMVLARDPGSVPDLASLTPAQCDHIAHELVWNRHAEPLPEPPRSLEELYTSTTRSGFPEMFIDADRNRFEAEITSYYARHDAEARQLASYIFALSAALYAERKSLNASRVAFRFPVMPGAQPTTGKIVEAEAILTD